MSAPRIAVVGGYGTGLTMRTSRVPGAGETIGGAVFSAGPGGKGSNQAVGVARLGVATALITALGDDDLAAAATTLWDDEGVDHSAVAHITGAATMAGVILVEPDGENRIIVAPGALDLLTADHVLAAEGVIAGSSLVLISQEVPSDVVVQALRLARAHGVTTLLNPAPARALPHGCAELVDVLTPNLSEARLLTGLDTDDPQRLADALRAAFPLALLVLTLGATGALVDEPGPEGVTNAGRYLVPARTGVTVVDTTGAGDAFNAALAVGLVQGRGVAEAVRLAVAAGAFAVTRHEVIPGLGRPSDLAAQLD